MASIMCAMCSLQCTNDAEKITITREEEVWCEATLTTTRSLNFCTTLCFYEFAENNLYKEFTNIRTNLSETGDANKPKHRRCVECAARCSGEILLSRNDKEETNKEYSGDLNICTIACFEEFAERQLYRDFTEGIL